MSKSPGGDNTNSQRGAESVRQALTPLSTCKELKTPANDSERTSSGRKTKSSNRPQEKPGLITEILKHQRGKLLKKSFFFFCVSGFACPSLGSSSVPRAECSPFPLQTLESIEAAPCPGRAQRSLCGGSFCRRSLCGKITFFVGRSLCEKSPL